MPPSPSGTQRLKLHIDSDVLDQAAKRAEAETTEVKKVYVADVARDAIFSLAASSGGTAEHIELRPSANRRRWPLTIQRVPYQAAKEALRSRGISVAAAVEEGLIRYVKTGKVTK